MQTPPPHVYTGSGGNEYLWLSRQYYSRVVGGIECPEPHITHGVSDPVKSMVPMSYPYRWTLHPCHSLISLLEHIAHPYIFPSVASRVAWWDQDRSCYAPVLRVSPSNYRVREQRSMSSTTPSSPLIFPKIVSVFILQNTLCVHVQESELEVKRLWTGLSCCNE